MKILHTADWHLGKKIEQYSRFPEQVEVMEEIIDIADKEDVNAVIISGDLFDNFNPSNEAVELFYKTLKKLTNNGSRLVVAIAGNHDSPERIEAPEPLALENGILLIGYPHSKTPVFELESGIKVLKSDKGFVEFELPNINYPFRILTTPYANEYRLKTFLNTENKEEEMRSVLEKFWFNNADKYCDNNGVNILMAHLFMIKKGEEIKNEELDDEKPILNVGGAQVIYTENIPPQIQYTALGHLHRFHSVESKKGKVFYSGSPISYSFSETNQKKYVSIVNLEPNKIPKVNKIEITKGKKLLKSKFSDITEAVKWLKENSNSLVEITIQSKEYLKSDDRKTIYNSHNGIVSIIPELIGENEGDINKQKVDLSKNMEDLFEQYFISKKGQKPNDDIKSLFKELKAL